MNDVPAAGIADRIAARFEKPLHRHYARFKIRIDPVFAAAASRLARGERPPLLDIGCGLGLLGQFLAEHGRHAPYRGIDLDAAKIGAAAHAARQAGFDFEFASGSASCLPPHRGDVALIDVLHYLPAHAQRDVLHAAAARLSSGGVLLIRSVIAEANWRFVLTRLEETLAHQLGWMRCAIGHFPRREEIVEPLRASGLEVETMPLWGRTPFNSHLIVARRREA